MTYGPDLNREKNRTHLLSVLSRKRRKTRKELFPGRMDDLRLWDQLLEVIAPVYPKAGNGRRPYPLSTMLRIHFIQNWYSLSDEGMEDALYEIASMRLFADLSLDRAIRDRSTIMNFRHLLEQHKLARTLHGAERFISGDAGYRGAEKRKEPDDVTAAWRIARRPGKVKALKQDPVKHRKAAPEIREKALKRAKNSGKGGNFGVNMNLLRCG